MYTHPCAHACTQTYTHLHPLSLTHASKIVMKRGKKPPPKVMFSVQAKGRITLCQQQKQMG